MTTDEVASTAQSPVQTVHVSNSFQLVVPAPFNQAATLFGPEGERCWAGEHWNPNFLHPQPAKDIEGAVFTIQHGAHKSVWVNTLFDPAGGRMQYVSFIADQLVSTIDVRLTSLNSSTTSVGVTYARTALDPTMNEEVQAKGVSDRASGPHWQTAIESYLKDQH